MNPTLTNEELLILLTYSTLSNSETDKAKDLIDRIDSWNDFWELTYQNRVVPLVQSNLEKINCFKKLPKDIQLKFTERSKEVKTANEERLVIGRELFKKFAANNVPVIILKGVNFAETIYKNPYYRRMNDIDILIQKKDLDTIFDIYEEMNFFSASELLGGEPRKQKEYSHHLPSFFSRDVKCVIGTHWGLVTPLAPYKIDYDSIWSRVENFDFYNIPTLSMSPEDNLHHLCVHLPDYKSGLKEIADIYNIIRHYNEKINWDIFLQEVEKAKTKDTVYHAFSVCNKISPMGIFDEIITKIEKDCSRSIKKFTKRKVKHLDVLLRSRSVHMARIEKAFNELNFTKKPAEKWKAFLTMWKNLLIQPKEDIIMINSFKNPTFFHILYGKFSTPYRICKVFTHDVGKIIFIIILLKSIFDVILCTITTPFKSKSSIQDIEYYAKELGVSIEDLKKLKDSQE